VLHQIGNGALGPVFRAYDSDRDRLVAIKVFRLDLPPERVHQLVAEFEQLIAAELQHPVIAAARATGIDAGSNAFLAQDFAAADSLDIVVRENGRASLANTLRVASQLAEALDYAAERQVLHGALHPRDIVLSEDDIRIVGVGVSRALERVGVTTPVRRPYSAPERMNDEGWDRRADVFSLAAIVYELLCGRRVAGTGSEAAESLTDVTGCDVAALQRVFALALAADPAYRYATATAFADALKDAAASEADAAELADVSGPTPKARRPRTELRVVTPPDGVEELALSDVEEPSLPLITFSDDIEEQLAAEPPPKIRLPRRRKVPAPTPVAIETVASADLLRTPDPVEEFASIDQADLIAVADTPLVDAHLQREGSPLESFAFEPAPVHNEPLLVDDPPVVRETPLLFDPEPAFEEFPAHDAVPEEVSPPTAQPRLPAFLEPPAPRTPAATASHSPVWPIGVAAVIGVAVGFGFGYTVAIRDHAVAAPTVAAASASANVVVPPAVEPPAAASEAPPVPIVPPEQSPAPAFSGRVLVRSSPPGARVFVDGRDRGQTPGSIGDLGRGEHRIRVLRDGYTTAERRVVLTPAQPSQSLSVPLAREPRARGNAAVEQKPKSATAVAPAPIVETGALAFETRPQGATVMLDGRRAGTTPLTIGDVRAGNHAVRIELDGYRPWSGSIAIKGGEQNRVTASLEK
jgi:hypothetical protein